MERLRVKEGWEKAALLRWEAFFFMDAVQSTVRAEPSHFCARDPVYAVLLFFSGRTAAGWVTQRVIGSSQPVVICGVIQCQALFLQFAVPAVGHQAGHFGKCVTASQPETGIFANASRRSPLSRVLPLTGRSMRDNV